MSVCVRNDRPTGTGTGPLCAGKDPSVVLPSARSWALRVPAGLTWRSGGKPEALVGRPGKDGRPPEQGERGTCRQTGPRKWGASVGLALPALGALARGAPPSASGLQGRRKAASLPPARTPSLKGSPSRLEPVQERRLQPHSGDWGCVSIALCIHIRCSCTLTPSFPLGSRLGVDLRMFSQGTPVQLR